MSGQEGTESPDTNDNKTKTWPWWLDEGDSLFAKGKGGVGLLVYPLLDEGESADTKKDTSHGLGERPSLMEVLSGRQVRRALWLFAPVMAGTVALVGWSICVSVSNEGRVTEDLIAALIGLPLMILCTLGLVGAFHTMWTIDREALKAVFFPRAYRRGGGGCRRCGHKRR